MVKIISCNHWISMHWLITLFRWAVRVGTFLAIWNIQLSEIHWNDTLHVSQVSTRSGKAGDQRPPTPCGCLVCSWRLGKHTSHQFAVLGSVCGTFDSLDKDLDRDRVICNFMWNTCFLIAPIAGKENPCRCQIPGPGWVCAGTNYGGAGALQLQDMD